MRSAGINAACIKGEYEGTNALSSAAAVGGRLQRTVRRIFHARAKSDFVSSHESQINRAAIARWIRPSVGPCIHAGSMDIIALPISQRNCELALYSPVQLFKEILLAEKNGIEL